MNYFKKKRSIKKINWNEKLKPPFGGNSLRFCLEYSEQIFKSYRSSGIWTTKFFVFPTIHTNVMVEQILSRKLFVKGLCRNFHCAFSVLHDFFVTKYTSQHGFSNFNLRPLKF